MTLSMDREIAIEWIERLESLDPELQGKGYLYVDGKMCCLGVLCEIAKEKGIVDAIDTHHLSNGSTAVFYGVPGAETTMDQNYLPKAVIDWAGIENDVPYNPIVKELNLAVWNDDRETSFKDIAGMLRDELGIKKD